MKDYDEKEFLDLLNPYEHEESRRARRILATSAFIVIAAAFLDADIQSISILGVPLNEVSNDRLRVIGLIYFAYWLVAALLLTIRDKYMDMERGNSLDAYMTMARNYIEKEKNKGGNPLERDYSGRYARLLNHYETYDRQKQRTRLIRLLNHFLNWASRSVPFALGVVALLATWNV